MIFKILQLVTKRTKTVLINSKMWKSMVNIIKQVGTCEWQGVCQLHLLYCVVHRDGQSILFYGRWIIHPIPAKILLF